MSEIKRGDLVKAAKELNTVIAPKPLINLKAKADELKKLCIKGAKLLDATDEVTEPTIATLVAIGAKLPKGMGPETEDEKTKDKKGKKGKKDSTKGVTSYDDRLVAAANDLNGLEGIVDEIDVESEKGDLEVLLKEAAEIVDEDDELSEDTWAILYQLEVGPRFAADQAKEKKTKTKSKAKGKDKSDKSGSKDKAKTKDKDKKTPTGGKSNKVQAWDLWKKGKGETDAGKIAKKLGDAVKETTIKSWLASWGKGVRLPAGCK